MTWDKPVILAAATPQVLLPYDNANRFLHGLAAHRGATASWTAWVVPRTLKPAEAAKEVGISEAALREVGRLLAFLKEPEPPKGLKDAWQNTRPLFMKARIAVGAV